MLNKIKSDQFDARKNKDSVKSSLLTTLYAEAAMIGKNNGNRNSTDDEVIKVMHKFLKGINETISILSAGKSERYFIALQEKDIIESYLPKVASQQEVETAIVHLIDSGITKMGDIMKSLKDKFGTSLDAKQASVLIKEKL
jgi:uncharacterized protein YqeY